MRLRKRTAAVAPSGRNHWSEGAIHGFYAATCTIIATNAKIKTGDGPRICSSFFCLLLTVALSFWYNWPDEFVRMPTQDNERKAGSLVVIINSLTDFPVWTLLFTISAISIGISFMLKHEWIKWGHYVNFLTLFFYSASVWFGAFAAPGTYVVAASFSMFAAAVNYSLAISYSERPL